MQKIISVLFLLLTGIFFSCSHDTLWQSMNDIKDRVSNLEPQCDQMNSNVKALYSLLEVLDGEKRISDVQDISEESEIIGYMISFDKGESIKLYLGKDGITPKISVRRDNDSIYYWTANDEWLVDSAGSKVQVNGIDGKTPLFCIQEGRWLLSWDHGDGWVDFGQATGDSLFSKLDHSNENYVVVTLADGQILEIPTVKLSKSCEIRFFKFLAEDNPQALLQDVVATIEGDEISIRIPYVMATMNLRPCIGFVNPDAIIKKGEMGKEVDFSSPVEYVIENSKGDTRKYIVNVTVFTGLPIIFIETDNNEDIVSKDEYKNAIIRIEGNALSFVSEVKIKGRGNSTWTLPKKPYKLKFSEKVSLLGEPKDKEWILLANYTDKTNLRNETAFYMGRISELAWTPRTHFVEVFVNDVYNGTYQLCEQVKIATSRVNVTDDGFLLEIDNKDRLDPDDVYFETSRLLLNIKDPEVDINSARYQSIKDYFSEAENVLFSDNFKDPINGYRKYLNVNSFVDWYLINEISKNNDAVFFSSCYMNISSNNKISMGPIWDFDIAFGNVNYNNNQSPEGFWIKNASWIKRLFEDPYFVQKVKERFDYFEGRKNDIFININKSAETLHYSVIENNNKWLTLYTSTWPNYAVWGAYENEVQYMKIWLEKRFAWLRQALNG